MLHMKNILDVPQVAEYLNLHENTVYKLLQEGKLPGRKVGDQWRVSQEQLEAWIECQKVTR